MTTCDCGRLEVRRHGLYCSICKELFRIEEPIDAFALANLVFNARPGDPGYNSAARAAEVGRAIHNHGWMAVGYDDYWGETTYLPPEKEETCAQ